MIPGIAYIFAILFIVIALNLFITFRRARNTGNNRRNRSRPPPDEEKQAIWRDKEIARRIEREQDDAYERLTLRNETLAYYETVRQRHAKKDSLERLGISTDDNLDDLKSLGIAEYLSEDSSD
ncbi:MAG: hypothetical protein FWD44_01450 [Oscillospiraceae bacterium]|nr:hypothetical protein [Oscillospiraceae bacterium]